MSPGAQVNAQSLGPETAPPEPRKRRFEVAGLRDYGIVITFCALFVVLAVSSDSFLTGTNLLNILDQWAPLGIMACGMTLVLIGGGFDLSVGAGFVLGGVVAAKVANTTGIAPGWLLGCLVGLAVGLLNGLLVTVARINAFVATLATGIILSGAALAVTSGQLIVVEKDGFDVLGRGEFLGLKVSVYIFLATVIILGVLLHLSTFGRALFAVGGNAEAARLSGVRVGVVRATTYVIVGLCAALAGVITASRTTVGQPDAGTFTDLFNIFAAVIIGGTSITGGFGAMWRTVIGVLLLALMGNGFNLANIDPVYQSMITGAIILFAVAVDVWVSNRRFAS
jgi:ribose transport system permease protein